MLPACRHRHPQHPASLRKGILVNPRTAAVSNPRRARVGLRTAAIVLAATAFPVVTLLWASSVAKGEVEDRALAGMAAIGKATSLQEQQAWDDAIRIVASAAGGSGLLTTLQSHNPDVARQVDSQSASNIRIAR